MVEVVAVVLEEAELVEESSPFVALAVEGSVSVGIVVCSWPVAAGVAACCLVGKLEGYDSMKFLTYFRSSMQLEIAS